MVISLKTFIDLDKKNQVIYNNLYLDDLKIVIKMPLVAQEEREFEVKFEKFDLTKYNYLVAYE